MCPPELVEHHQHGIGGYRRKRIDQFIEPEFLDVGGSNLTVTVAEFGELQLRDADRILVAHAHGHQPRDLAEHRLVDVGPADEPPQPIDVKPGDRLCIATGDFVGRPGRISTSFAGLAQCVRPFGPEYLVLHALTDMMATAAFHFTRNPSFFANGPCGSFTGPKALGGFDGALVELAAERPDWRLTLTGMNQAWLATIQPPVPPEGPPSRTFVGGEATTPAEAVRDVLELARSNDG